VDGKIFEKRININKIEKKTMKKIVRLTESDLVRLIKRVINEQSIS
jgi:hypothetical protein